MLSNQYTSPRLRFAHRDVVNPYTIERLETTFRWCRGGCVTLGLNDLLIMSKGPWAYT